ncbi:hypothetical protein [Bifidobacterium aesculapii]|uniref:hypothetical protein n=1 Tax=Bifidobacterium aesculapii TaxID=1329411 RepID=UPI0006E44C51|nr:hypothetical protein [Bifidobacterium aesculapii]
MAVNPMSNGRVITPANTLPGDVPRIVNGEVHVGVDAGKSAQQLLKRYGYGAWVYVQLIAGLIPRGRSRGESAYHVMLDGREVGWLDSACSARHAGQVVNGDAWFLAHVPDRPTDRLTNRFSLRVSMPRPLAWA